MNRIWMRLACLLAIVAVGGVGEVGAQSLDSPMTRLRPIGSPSAVDQYRRPIAVTVYRETAYENPVAPVSGNTVSGNPFTVTQAAGVPMADGSVRQSVMMQQIGAPPLPPGGFAPPVVTTTPILPPSDLSAMPAPVASAPPRALPSAPGGYRPSAPGPSGAISSGDAALIAPPELGSEFATIGNCNCISAPSDYSAASGIGCGMPETYNAPVSYNAPAAYTAPPTYAVPPSYVAPPAQVAAPVVLPAVGPVPVAAGPPSRVSPVGPLVTFGQQRNTVQVGQGIVGQPVAYVPGQRFRNWVRYFFP